MRKTSRSEERQSYFFARKYYQIGNNRGEKMRWQIINGWYCVTACGLMSWRFRSWREAVEWAFTTKLARSVADEM